MTPLVLVTALFLGSAAFFKARAGSRLGMGISIFVVLEGLGSIVLVLVGLPGPLVGSAIARAAVPAAVLRLVVSSLDHARRLKSVRERREATEGGRLAAYVKYESEAHGGDLRSESGTDPSRSRHF